MEGGLKLMELSSVSKYVADGFASSKSSAEAQAKIGLPVDVLDKGTPAEHWRVVLPESGVVIATQNPTTSSDEAKLVTSGKLPHNKVVWTFKPGYPRRHWFSKVIDGKFESLVHGTPREYVNSALFNAVVSFFKK